MHARLPPPLQALDAAPLNTDRVPRPPISINNAMQQAGAALGAEVAVLAAAVGRVGGAPEDAHARGELGRQGKQAGGGVDGGGAEGGARLLLALGAVAVEERERLRRRRRERHVPALAPHRQWLCGCWRGHPVVRCGRGWGEGSGW